MSPTRSSARTTAVVASDCADVPAPGCVRRAGALGRGSGRGFLSRDSAHERNQPGAAACVGIALLAQGQVRARKFVIADAIQALPRTSASTRLLAESQQAPGGVAATSRSTPKTDGAGLPLTTEVDVEGGGVAACVRKGLQIAGERWRPRDWICVQAVTRGTRSVGPSGDTSSCPRRARAGEP